MPQLLNPCSIKQYRETESFNRERIEAGMPPGFMPGEFYLRDCPLDVQRRERTRMQKLHPMDLLPSNTFVKQHPDYCLEQGRRCAQWFEGVCLRCSGVKESNPIGDDSQCGLTPPIAPVAPYRHDDCVWLEWEGWRYAPAHAIGSAGDMALWLGQYDGRYGKPFQPYKTELRNVYAQGYREGQATRAVS